MKEKVRDLVNGHLNLRPRMEVQDIYKLLFQSVMGLGHILHDHGAAYQYLLDELATLDPTAPDDVLVEDISLGNDMVRVNLRPFRQQNLDPQQLFAAMLATESRHHVDAEKLRDVWESLLALAAEGAVSVDKKSLAALDTMVREQGYPVLHHSVGYGRLYQPAYRVILGSFLPGLT